MNVKSQMKSMVLYKLRTHLFMLRHEQVQVRICTLQDVLTHMAWSKISENVSVCQSAAGGKSQYCCSYVQLTDVHLTISFAFSQQLKIRHNDEMHDDKAFVISSIQSTTHNHHHHHWQWCLLYTYDSISCIICMNYLQYSFISVHYRNISSVHIIWIHRYSINSMWPNYAWRMEYNQWVIVFMCRTYRDVYADVERVTQIFTFGKHLRAVGVEQGRMKRMLCWWSTTLYLYMRT